MSSLKKFVTLYNRILDSFRSKYIMIIICIIIIIKKVLVPLEQIFRRKTPYFHVKIVSNTEKNFYNKTIMWI